MKGIYTPNQSEIYCQTKGSYSLIPNVFVPQTKGIYAPKPNDFTPKPVLGKPFQSHDSDHAAADPKIVKGRGGEGGRLM